MSTTTTIAEVHESAHIKFNTALIRVPLLALLFSVAAIYEANHLTAFADYDTWWHLRTGVWILQNHAVPHHSLFSQYSDRSWMAYSWGFEVITAVAYKLLGLRSIPILLMGFKAALAVILFVLARGSRWNVWPAVFLSTIGQYAITDFKVRPGFFSVLFFGIELILLLKSQRTGNIRPLFWLPLLFALWANLHIQFVYGIFALFLFLVVVLLESVPRRFNVFWFQHKRGLPVLPVTTITGACVIATFLSPYSYHLYQIIWQYAHSTATYAYILEMHAMNFRWPEHYARLLLAAAAFFSLGSQRPRNLFGVALLTIGTIVAFRQQRDAWFMLLPSIATIADVYFVDHSAEARARTWEGWMTAAFVIAALATAVIAFIPSSRDALLAKVNETFPVEACNFIRENHLPQPIFNTMNWGGFLTWYLPEYPVSMDGRTDLYGDEIVTRQYKVLDGELPPSEEPTLVNARTLLLKKDTGIAAALSESPGYGLVYSDDKAVVFVRTQ